MDYYKSTTIQELLDNGIISKRTSNCLTYAGYTTIGDIVAENEDLKDLLHIRNLGPKSYTEICDVIFNVKNNMLTSQIEVLPAETQKIFDCIDEAFEQTVSNNSIISEHLKSNYSTSRDLHKALINNFEIALKIEPDLCLDDNISLRKQYLSFISRTIANLEIKELSEKPIYPLYKRLETELGLRINEFTIYEKAHYFMSAQLHKCIESTYMKMLQNKLSLRARNFANSYLPSFENIIIYFDKPIGAYSQICPGKWMKKTLYEIYNFNQDFKKIYLQLCDESDDELNDWQILQKYPYLLSGQRHFVKQFISEHKHVPIFFILYEYLRISEDRTDKIFSLLHGLFDNKKRTLNEIAQVYNVTRERVRQLSLKRTSIQASIDYFVNDLSMYNSVFELPFICEDTERFVQIRAEEKLTYSFDVFAAILSQITDFKIIEANEHTIAINNKSNLSRLPINDYILTLESLSKSKFAQETSVPIGNITHHKTGDSDLTQLISFIANKAFGLVVEDEQILFSQNYIDISEELYQILLRKGEPMSVSDIFSLFKIKYPDHPFSEPLQIKPYLYHNEHIRSIGKQSLYGLDFWKNIYFGSIRDLMYEIISSSDEPVDIGQIYEQVIEYFPKTNIRSIASSMQSDSLNRFVSFGDGYFGIKEKEYGTEFTERRVFQRYNFEDRMNSFRDFVDTYHRFPLSTGGEEEASLRRWYYNVENYIIDIPSEEALDDFLNMIEHYNQMGIPRTGYESEFLNNCERYQEFINSTYKLPSAKNGEDLYWWFKRSLDNYDSYVDHRRQYLTMLINYIRSLGFSI